MSNLCLYKVLYSIGEERCIGCEEIIEAGGIKITQQIDDCEYDWYHTECLFEDCLPRRESDIEGFSILEIQDQNIIRAQLVPKALANLPGHNDFTENVTKCFSGCVVDPDSELEDYTHVYSKTDEHGALLQYSVTLTYVDIGSEDKPLNEFHRIQLLSANEYEYYWVFQSWGSIKSVAECSKKTTTHESLANAVKEFESVYRDKTGNNFGALCFAKFPQKYYHLGVTIVPKKTQLPNLIPPVQQLMQLILDAKQKSSKPIVLHLIKQKLPLGNLTVNQIFDAMVLLETINTLIQNTFSELDRKDILDACNDFYCMIPHTNPSIIDYEHSLNEKDKMLHALWGEQIFINCRDNETGNINLPALYQFLNAEIKPLEESHQDFGEIRRIVRSTHSPTHDQYALEVLSVHKVKRYNEELRFHAYENLPNRRLLWHGSRMENFVEILLHGLKIAPEGAHITGSAFGKGIYFADVVSKSANYLGARKTGDVRLMLLCEVALGTSKEINGNKYQQITGIPNAIYQSFKGCGATVPTQSSTIEGVEIASGPLQKSTFHGLLHNEYVVYDPAQVKLKYIVKVKFEYSAKPYPF